MRARAQPPRSGSPEADTYYGLKRTVGVFVWLSAGWAALETFAALALFEGSARWLVIVPVAWCVGAVACARAWRRTAEPSGPMWALAFFFCLLAMAELLIV